MLEEFGILPNYTLLDDMVTLDVSVTWIDPETQEYQLGAGELPALVGERAARVRARGHVLRAGPGDPHRRGRPRARRLGDQDDGVLPAAAGSRST